MILGANFSREAAGGAGAPGARPLGLWVCRAASPSLRELAKLFENPVDPALWKPECWETARVRQDAYISARRVELSGVHRPPVAACRSFITTFLSTKTTSGHQTEGGDRGTKDDQSCNCYDAPVYRGQTEEEEEKRREQAREVGQCAEQR